jgi:imidazolonepropionase-like amidohydrolase
LLNSNGTATRRSNPLSKEVDLLDLFPQPPAALASMNLASRSGSKRDSHPIEAIHIATENGARFLGEESGIGTLASGKQADLVVILGDPSKTVARSRRSRSC